ncbi:MAG: hypothetical protein AAF617_09275 [Bacteroidota bacterium]
MGKSKKQKKTSTPTKQSALLLKRYREDPQGLLNEINAPVVATLNDVIYRAYMRPYPYGDDVLVILANGYYDPTPAHVELYIESQGNNTYKLMQNNSVVTFGLVTYHTATFTSPGGVVGLGQSITIEDANGTHTVKVESF